VVDKRSRKVICTAFCNGKKHDFKLFQESKVRWTKSSKGLVDSGYTGIKKIHSSTELPKKKTKKNPLTMEEKKQNREISSQRIENEHGLGFLKRFKVLSERYRNRRKRFGLRFNLIAGICNHELLKAVA
jgi:transposase